MARYMGSFVKEKAFEKALKNDDLKRDVVNMLAPLATVMDENETVERRAARLSEAEMFHQLNVKTAKENLAYRIIDLNRRYCDGKLIHFVHMDNPNEIEDLLCDFWEACVRNYETLLETA